MTDHDPPSIDPSLTDLRQRLAELDRDLLTLVARRQELAAAVGLLKNRNAGALKDAVQERGVIARARATAAQLGTSTELAEELLTLLMRHSLAVQEQQRIRTQASGDGQRALVIGGAGRIGAWFVRFLRSQGYDVEIADPAPLPADLTMLPHRTQWEDGPLLHNLIVVAAPLRQTAAMLSALAAHRPPGVVFDVGSLKSPLREGLDLCIRAGVRVTSVHPMFGPSVDLLAGRDLVIVDVGSAEANAAAEHLFAGTTVRVVQMRLDEHDEAMAYVLGLSHAVNIAFIDALGGSDAAGAHLARVSSTTFEAQVAVAARVASENPQLYYEIQHLNAHGLASLDALATSVERLRACVAAGDEAGFVAAMEGGRRFLAERLDRLI